MGLSQEQIVAEHGWPFATNVCLPFESNPFLATVTACQLSPYLHIHLPRCLTMLPVMYCSP